MAHKTHHDADTTDDMQHGYEAAAAGQVDFRHSRYWIDDSTGAELCRPDVVRGILNFYRAAENQQIDIANAANYRSLAAESRDLANAEYFSQQAKFYEDRAAQRTSA